MKTLISANALSAFALVLVAGAPALAGSFKAPEGCETFLTVQSRGCVVSNFYRCTADPAGDQWRADFDQEGIFFASRINSEAEWVESMDFDPKSVQRLAADPKDRASFSDLLSTGRDDYDFSLDHQDGSQSHVSGFDRLTGAEVTIDGRRLRETEYAFTELDADGNVLRQSRGHEYVDGELRNFFSGPSEFWDGADWVPFDGSPVKFFHPGQRGFASTQPVFECGALMSSYPKSPAAKEALSHDDL